MDAALVFIEIAVVVSKAACAADDGRPGWERVGAVLEERFSGFNPQELTSYLERLQKHESAKRTLSTGWPTEGSDGSRFGCSAKRNTVGSN
jgi:hypothetical protein